MSTAEKECESCARWERASFTSLFAYCPQCGHERDRDATQARDGRANLAAQEQIEAHKQSDDYLRVIQAVLDVYDEHVSQYGPNSKHVFFVVNYRTVAEKLNTTTYHVRKGLHGGADFERVLVDHGRGFFWHSVPPYRFRYFRACIRAGLTYEQRKQ